MPVRIEVPGAGNATGEAVFIVAEPAAESTLAAPDLVKPAQEPGMTASVIERTLPPYSLTVLRPAR
jgi:hypothetical protein